MNKIGLWAHGKGGGRGADKRSCVFRGNDKSIGDYGAGNVGRRERKGAGKKEE